MTLEINAVVRRDAPAGADRWSTADPYLDPGVHRLASFGLDQDGAQVGIVSVYRSAAIRAATIPSADEIVPLTEGCVANLLADGVAALAASTPGFDRSDEPPLVSPGPGRTVSAGIVLVDSRGRLTIREPTNHYGGYEWTYAKGRLDPGETPQQTAHRELLEETGLRARIVGLVGDFDGDTGVTRLYVGVRTGGVEAPSDETQTIDTVGPFTALERFNKPRDKDALVRLIELAASATDWTWTLAGESWRCRIVDGRVQSARAT